MGLLTKVLSQRKQSANLIPGTENTIKQQLINTTKLIE